jgi:hypothetical protein
VQIFKLDLEKMLSSQISARMEYRSPVLAALLEGATIFRSPNLATLLENALTGVNINTQCQGSMHTFTPTGITQQCH